MTTRRARKLADERGCNPITPSASAADHRPQRGRDLSAREADKSRTKSGDGASSTAASTAPSTKASRRDNGYHPLHGGNACHSGHVGADGWPVPAGYALVPVRASSAILRPFRHCPPGELQDAWEAALGVASIERRRNASRDHEAPWNASGNRGTPGAAGAQGFGAPFKGLPRACEGCGNAARVTPALAQRYRNSASTVTAALLKAPPTVTDLSADSPLTVKEPSATKSRTVTQARSASRLVTQRHAESRGVTRDERRTPEGVPWDRRGTKPRPNPEKTHG